MGEPGARTLESPEHRVAAHSELVAAFIERYPDGLVGPIFLEWGTFFLKRERQKARFDAS